LLGLKNIRNLSVPYSNKNVSVIVCVRNGALSLSHLLNTLKNQEYRGKIEFLIVDDQSIDDSKKIILRFREKDSRFKYINSNQDNSDLNHKKKALNIGIRSASFEYLLFTDVDCILSKGWVQSMMDSYNDNDYVIGYSEIRKQNTFISHFQSIDFSMLMLSCCSTTFSGYPLACSGQNQSYKKSLFLSVGGFNEIKNLLQGDDTLFLQICQKNKKNKVVFSINSNSFVYGKTINSLKNFIKQRVRWAGDANIMWRYNKIFFIVILSTFITNLFLIFLFIDTLLFQKISLLFVLLIIIKVILEFSLYYFGSKRLNRSISINSFFLWFIFNPIYTVLVGLLSFFSDKIKWRGRSSNTL